MPAIPPGLPPAAATHGRAGIGNPPWAGHLVPHQATFALLCCAGADVVSGRVRPAGLCGWQGGCWQWTARGGKHNDPARQPRPRPRATYPRPHGVRHLFAALDLAKDQLFGHLKKSKMRTTHKEQGSIIRRYIIWRNKHAADERLRKVVDRANVA